MDEEEIIEIEPETKISVWNELNKGIQVKDYTDHLEDAVQW